MTRSHSSPERPDGDLPTLSQHEDKKSSLQNGEHQEDPFGDEEDGEIRYRTMTWWQCSMIMIAETVSLGILSLPSAVAVLGLVP